MVAECNGAEKGLEMIVDIVPMAKVRDTHAEEGKESQFTKVALAVDPLPLSLINGMTGAVLAANVKR